MAFGEVGVSLEEEVDDEEDDERGAWISEDGSSVTMETSLFVWAVMASHELRTRPTWLSCCCATVWFVGSIAASSFQQLFLKQEEKVEEKMDVCLLKNTLGDEESV